MREWAGIFDWTPEHENFRRTVIKFVQEYLRPHIEQWEEDGVTPRTVWKKAGDLGLLGIRYPETYGGLSLDITFTLIRSLELGHSGCAGSVLGLEVQADMATPALANYGSKMLKERYLAPAISGDQICGIAVTEPCAGSDVAGIQTRAVREGDFYCLNGSKIFITNGSQADWLCTLARTNESEGHHAFSLFIVPTSFAGFRVSRKFSKMGYRSSDTVELSFENMRIPADHLIGNEGMGFTYQMEQFQEERLVGAVGILGQCERAYEITKTYIQQRQAFGKPLSKMQVTQHKMADILTEISAFRGLLVLCISQMLKKENATQTISMAKLFGARVLLRTVDQCVQLHGGYGYMEEYEICRAYRDAKLLSIGGGTDEIMKQIIAKMEGF
ncbi:MAG: acyl-CoA dehydrogenase family protein [Planctomycetota bacterium]